MTIFSIGNMLLAAGGDCGTLFASQPSADIHLFNPHSIANEWLKICELPGPRFLCACTVATAMRQTAGGTEEEKTTVTICCQRSIE